MEWRTTEKHHNFNNANARKTITLKLPGFIQSNIVAKC